jgi:hypothetical protein
VHIHLIETALSQTGDTEMTRTEAAKIRLSRLTTKQIAWVSTLTPAQINDWLSRRSYPYSFRDANELDLYDVLDDRRAGL